MVQICQNAKFDPKLKMRQSIIPTLAKVSDSNSFRVNQNYSDSFRFLYPSQHESFRTNLKNVLYLLWWKTVKSRSDLVRFNPRQQSEWIRTNPKPRFQSKSKPNFQSEIIRIRTIPIHSDFCIRANANHLESIWKMFCISFDEKR